MVTYMYKIVVVTVYFLCCDITDKTYFNRCSINETCSYIKISTSFFPEYHSVVQMTIKQCRAGDEPLPGPLFTKWTEVLPKVVVRLYTFPIALKFDWHIGSSAADMPAKLQSDKIIITPNLAASRFGGKTSYLLVNRNPESLMTQSSDPYMHNQALVYQILSWVV